jgi:WD40 repeat protein
MTRVPLAARVVEVIADRGAGKTPRYLCGSGCIVAGRTVLTAAHVLVDAVSLAVRAPNKVVHQAAADPRFTGHADGRGPDLALVEITDGGVNLPPMGLAGVIRDSPAGDPVERCHVIGYPEFMERVSSDGGRFRDTADALGHVPVLSGLAGGLLSVIVSSAPEPLPPAQVALGKSSWSGMSGGPLVADGLLLGVVTEHATRAGSSAITVTPLTALDRDPAHPSWGPGVVDPGAWWTRLGVPGAGALSRLPAAKRRSRPAYWATVQEIRQRSGMLTGRQAELADIGSFAAGNEGYQCLVGEPWAGKTALLAEAVTALPEVDTVSYFLSRREADADSSRFLAAVVPQLASLLNEEPPAVDLHQFRALWQRAAEQADTEGRPLLLVVDGLDEDLRPPGLPSVAALLPASAGGGAHVLVSSRQHPELPGDIPAKHPLRLAGMVQLQPFSGARELRVLARQEIDDLLRRDDDGLAADVLGLLAAAAGPLAVQDLAAMTTVAPQSAALARRIRALVKTAAARSLQTAGLAGPDRYQFAHESLLAYAQADDDLRDVDFRGRIHHWADSWRAALSTTADREAGMPRYLLDTYPATLTQEPQRLAELAGDIGWVEAAIESEGVTSVLADLRQAAAANPASSEVAAVMAAVTGQADELRHPQPVEQPGYILRQLWMQAAGLAEEDLAQDIRSRLVSRSGWRLVPAWTTSQVSRAPYTALGRHDDWVRAVAVAGGWRVVTGGSDGRVLVWDRAYLAAAPVELGRHYGVVRAVAILGDERVVTGGSDGRVLVWDPDDAGAAPAELGRHRGRVRAVAVLADGRVVTGGSDGRLLVWDPDDPGAPPAELGSHDDWVQAVAVLADGRVVTGGVYGRVLVWDPAYPGTAPAELGSHDDWVRAVAVLGDGRVVTGGSDRRVLVWDPAYPGAVPAELGRHDGVVRAVAVLGGGRVVTGGSDGRVLVWDVAKPGTQIEQLSCSVTCLATSFDMVRSSFVIAHELPGVSVWSFRQ